MPTLDLTRQEKWVPSVTEDAEALKKQGPPRPGLVPQSGDVEHPVRWVRPDRETEGRGLKIPPGWSDVWINEDPEAPLQATGVDSKGRKQYVYSKAHSEKAAAEKFARLKEFDATLPKIREQVFRDLNQGKDEAAILYLIDKTGFRIGSNRDTKSKEQAFGASTLLGKHVNVDGEVVSFNFIGKKGVRQSKRVVDPVLAAAINERKGEPDQPLFGATDSHVRRYLNQIADRPFNVKDFRTWHGTNAAREIMADLPSPQDSREFDRSRRIVGQQVAEILGNTPDMALNSYIAPEVFSEWKAPLAEAGMVRKDLSDLFETISYDNYGDWVNTPETHVDEDEVSEISKQQPPRPGLVPQSGDPEHPYRWIRPKDTTEGTQGKHLTEIAPHLTEAREKLVAGIASEWERNAKDWDIPLTEFRTSYENKVQPLLDKADVWTRTNVENLQQILSDGRFKTVSESKITAPGKPRALRTYISIREDYEEELFGIPKKKNHEVRPVYGYVSDEIDGAGHDSFILSSFGNIRIKMKPHVKDKSTITISDSIDTNAGHRPPRLVPHPINEFKVEATIPYSFSPTSEYSSINDLAYDYVEAQIHGGVTTEDIEEVVFNTDVPEEILRTLDDLGIRHTKI
jgi:DNA topoisomerase IB